MPDPEFLTFHLLLETAVSQRVHFLFLISFSISRALASRGTTENNSPISIIYCSYSSKLYCKHLVPGEYLLPFASFLERPQSICGNFKPIPGLACMCVPYCCTEYASPGVSQATHTFQGRLEEAGCPYHMSTGNYRHWTPQMSARFLVGRLAASFGTGLTFLHTLSDRSPPNLNLEGPHTPRYDKILFIEDQVFLRDSWYRYLADLPNGQPVPFRKDL